MIKSKVGQSKKGVALSHTLRCSSDWKGRQLSLLFWKLFHAFLFKTIIPINYKSFVGTKLNGFKQCYVTVTI